MTKLGQFRRSLALGSGQNQRRQTLSPFPKARMLASRLNRRTSNHRSKRLGALGYRADSGNSGLDAFVP